MQREFYRLKDNDKPSLSLVGAGELTLSIRIVSVNAKRTRCACPVSARNRTRSMPEGNNDEHVSLSTLVSSFLSSFCSFFFPASPIRYTLGKRRFRLSRISAASLVRFWRFRHAVSRFDAPLAIAIAALTANSGELRDSSTVRSLIVAAAKLGTAGYT